MKREPLFSAEISTGKDSRRSRTGRDGGSVPRVSPITAPGNNGGVLDFQSTQRLSTQAILAIDEAFAKGWLEPQKIHHGSAHLRNLLNEARESIAAELDDSQGFT